LAESAKGRPLLKPRGNAKALRLERPALHERAVDRLRDLIIHGELAPGERVAEVELSQALGISRTPLREALKLLAAEGLVDIQPHRGARVAAMQPREVKELFEVVSALERLAAELAASRMNESELRRLRGLQEKMERHHRTGRLNDYFALNHKIHALIVACARNAALIATHEWLLARVQRARYFALQSKDRWDESVKEHRALLLALEARDVVRAGEILSHHVRRTGEVVVSVIAAAEPAMVAAE
jgi:DNA-binding GntR family transcriptional regulator